MKLKNIVQGAIVAGSLATLVGCAKWKNDVAADGGIIGSYDAPYIVINESGSEIMDVYKLPSAIMKPEDGGAGWLFIDANGHATHLGAGIKSIRLKNERDPLWDKYHEYHAEFESKTYRELYNPSTESQKELQIKLK